MKRLIYLILFVSSCGFSQQFARPSVDADNTGAWTPSTGTTLWGVLDDTYNTDFSDWLDNDGSAAAGEVFTVKLSAVTDPNVNTGHIIKCSVGKDVGGALVTITLELRQGYINEGSPGTLIRSTLLVNNYDGPGPTSNTITLTITQANNITDYSDLYLRGYTAKVGGGANRTVRFFELEFEVPSAGPPPPRNRVIIIN